MKEEPNKREELIGEWVATAEPTIKYRAFLDTTTLARLARKAADSKGKQAIDGPIRVVILLETPAKPASGACCHTSVPFWWPCSIVASRISARHA